MIQIHTDLHHKAIKLFISLTILHQTLCPYHQCQPRAVTFLLHLEMFLEKLLIPHHYLLHFHYQAMYLVSSNTKRI